MAEQRETAETVGIAVLLGFDPETGKTTADEFREREADDVTGTSPWHRAAALRESVRDDFPGRIWSIGVNDRARDLMAAENMRRMGLGDVVLPPAESCSCPDPARAVDACCPLHGHSPERRLPPGSERDRA